MKFSLLYQYGHLFLVAFLFLLFYNDQVRKDKYMKFENDGKLHHIIIVAAEDMNSLNNDTTVNLLNSDLSNSNVFDHNNRIFRDKFSQNKQIPVENIFVENVSSTVANIGIEKDVEYENNTSKENEGIDDNNTKDVTLRGTNEMSKNFNNKGEEVFRNSVINEYSVAPYVGELAYMNEQSQMTGIEIQNENTNMLNIEQNTSNIKGYSEINLFNSFPYFIGNRHYYGVIKERIFSKYVDPKMFLPLTQLYYFSLTLQQPQFLFNHTDFSDSSYSYSTHVVPACSSAIDGFIQGFTIGGLKTIQSLKSMFETAKKIFYSPLSEGQFFDMFNFNNAQSMLTDILSPNGPSNFLSKLFNNSFDSNEDLSPALLDFGVCAVTNVITSKSANIMKETCSCMDGNDNLGNSSKCSLYNSVFAALGCTATPPDCTQINLRANKIQLNDASMLDLPLDNLLSGIGTLPEYISHETILREGFTYYLVWKTVNNVYKLYKASFCAKMSNTEQPQLNILPGWSTEAYIYTSPSSVITDTQLLSVISRRGDSIFIATRGTRTKFEWKLNFEAAQTSESTLKFPDNSIVKVKWPGRVHYGYASIFESLFPSVTAYLENLRVLTSSKSFFDADFPIKRIIVSGHSLGAAASILLSYQLSIIFPGKVDMIGFGSPKVGDINFVKAFAENVNARIAQFSLDPVTEMPCKNIDACSPEEAFVPTKMADDDIQFFYANPPGIVQILPEMLPEESWVSLGANLQAYAAHLCAYTCFFTSKFAPLDPNTQCKPPDRHSSFHPDEGVCPFWLISNF